MNVEQDKGVANADQQPNTPVANDRDLKDQLRRKYEEQEAAKKAAAAEGVQA